MDATMRQVTNVPNATAVPMRAPVNQFAHFRTYPKAEAKDVVRFNFDTLYSFAWLDVSREPIILSVPDTGGRYYLIPMLDMWTDVFSNVGSRTTGTKAGHYAIVSRAGAGPFVQVNRLDGVTMLTRLADLMVKYPPHANDYPILFRMRALGIEPGKPFDAAKLDPQTTSTINRAAKDALEELPVRMRKMGDFVNGWNIGREHMGAYGVAYQWRAAIAMGGLGANPPEDAVYPTAYVDGEGKPLSGANQYVLHFEKGQTPPAHAFWSVTMYDKDGYFIPNGLKRQALGDRDKLVTNADGSLDLLIQAESPGKEKQANWLPVAAGQPFNLLMRLYSPRAEILNRTWAPPPVVRLDAGGAGGRALQ